MFSYLIGTSRNFLDDISAADLFDWQSGMYFTAFFYDIKQKLGKRIGLFDQDDEE